MNPHYRDDRICLYHADCLDVLITLGDNSIDSVVCDPPYATNFRGHDWDRMHPDPGIWRHCLRVLKPGAYLLSFGGVRTAHRLTCDIEDAGFEIRDSIAWLYGGGLPKSPGALKPSNTPIIVARKPGPNVPLQIDACRNASGRWPANVVLDDVAAAALDAETSHLKAGGAIAPGSKGAHRSRGDGTVFGVETRARGPWEPYGDDGGGSRFFYCARAAASERPVVEGVRHATVKPLALMRWLVRLATPAGGVVLDPFAGSGTTLEAAALEGAHCIGIEREPAYMPLIMARLTSRPDVG